MNIIKRLRYNLFFLTHSVGYTKEYIERTYKIYIGHSKVIHVRDGYPVFSLSSPALFSKPSAHFFARILFRTIQNKNIPNLMSYAVNDICNVSCKHCSFFQGVEEKGRENLSLEQSKQLIQDAQELGVSVINFVGGEPLLRTDLADIIRSVDKTVSTTVMFTNGWLLKEKAKELRSAGLDSIYISIDSADEKIHDTIRGQEGLFKRAVAGLIEAKKEGFSVGISTCLTPEAYKRGELKKMMDFAQSLGVHEVIIFDAMPSGRYAFRKDLVDNDWTEEMIREVRSYNQDESFPGVLVWAYVSSHRSVGCSCGTSYMYISPYGDLMSCDFNHKKFGNILEAPLYKLWDGLTTKKEFCSSKWGGCKVKDSESRKSDCVVTGTGCC